MSRPGNAVGKPPKPNPLDRSPSPGARIPGKPGNKPSRAAPPPPGGYSGVSGSEPELYDIYASKASANDPPYAPPAPPRVRSVRLDSNMTSLRERVHTMTSDPSKAAGAANSGGPAATPAGQSPAPAPGGSFRQAVSGAMASDRDRTATASSSRGREGGAEEAGGNAASAPPARPARSARAPPSGAAASTPSADREAAPQPSGSSKGSFKRSEGGGAGGTPAEKVPATPTGEKTTQPTADKVDKEREHKFLGKRPLQYGLWAHRMAYLNAGLCLMAGAFALAFSRSETYGCTVGNELISSKFRYNLQGNCPTKYIRPGVLLGEDVCCDTILKPSNLAAIANGNVSFAKFVGAIYIIYSVFIVIIEDVEIGIGYGLWFPSDNWFYDAQISPMGVTHILMGIVGLTNLGTCVAGVCLIINGIVYIEALQRQEAGDGGREVARKQKERDAKAKVAEEEKRGKGGTSDDEVEFECSTCPKTFGKSPFFKWITNACGSVWEILQYNPLSFLYRIWQEDKLAAYFWMGLFLLGNAIMFGVTYRKWQGMIEDEQKSLLDGTIDVLCDTVQCEVNRTAVKFGPFSAATPLAKACGGCLNMDCAILLLPVIKTILRKMNDMAGKFQDLQDRTDYFSKFFSHSFARYVPIQKNIEFHKLVALMVGVMTVGHMLGHYANIVVAFDVTTAYFEKWGWRYTSFFTGAIIFIAMFVIFSAAADIIRHTKFEIFFSAHHCFVIFYIFMFLHGPRFWYWGSIPVALYIYERYAQTKRGGKPFVVTKVEFVNPVMALYFKPVFSKDFSFKEGQYLYLCCPYISESEWHPFTISSAQDDMTSGPRIHLETGEEVLEVPRPANLHPNAKWNKYHLVSQNWKDLNPNDYIDKSETSYNDFLSCHIKIHGLEDPIAKTWTRKFKEYLEAVSGNVVGTNHFPFFFNSVDQRGDTQVGRLQDAEGRQLIRVDGPHSAPSEHFTNYGTCMIVGGGIGLTPCASVISALIKHRWKRGLNPEILHLYWVVRQGEVDSFQWLVHLLTELSYEYKKAREENTIASTMYCEFNIFVTAVDKKEKKVPLPFQKPKRRYTGNSTTPLFTADALYNLMLNPNVSSKKMIDTVKRGGNSPNRLQDVWVWDGRPEWDQIFADVKEQRQHSDIGVCFCGAPVIGNDLKKMCERYSSSRDDCLFTLHKENF